MFQNSCSCLKNIWLLILSIILIISGIYVLCNPLSALITSVILIGIFFIMIGCSYLLSFKDGDSYAIFALATLNILIGLIFLTNIGVTAINLPIILSFWILFNSIIQMAMGFEVKKNNSAVWKGLVGTSIFGLIFAILIFIYPIIGTVAITVSLGAYLIGYGLFELYRFKNILTQNKIGE